MLRDGVLHTGDLGRFDENGCLHITGRKKDILVLGDGTKLYLPECEQELSALLGNPELLILDEPVNGLDPMGMRDVRDIINFINKEYGVTFLISSHLLGELEKVANVYGIINQGVLLEELSSEELDRRCGSKISVACTDPRKACTTVRELFGIENVSFSDEGITIEAPPDISARVNTELVRSGIEVSRLEIISKSYEDYLLERMGTLNVGSGVGQYV